MIGEAAAEVGPALFFSLLIITLSFIPVFTLEAQEGRLFKPLAYTKTYAMAAAAGLAVTLIPVLMGYLIRGRIPAERANPLNRCADCSLSACCLNVVLRAPKLTLVVAAAVFARQPVAAAADSAASSCRHSTKAICCICRPRCRGLSIGKASELLQQTDRLIRTLPEVARVFGKAGRAETATDPGAARNVRDDDPVHAARPVAHRA